MSCRVSSTETCAYNGICCPNKTNSCCCFLLFFFWPFLPDNGVGCIRYAVLVLAGTCCGVFLLINNIYHYYCTIINVISSSFFFFLSFVASCMKPVHAWSVASVIQLHKSLHRESCICSRIYLAFHNHIRSCLFTIQRGLAN